MGADGAGRSAMLRHVYGTLNNDGRVIYQIGPDPSGLAAPFYPIRSLLAAVLQLPAVSSEMELRDAVLAHGLNERDIPGIAQLFGHPTSLLELERRSAVARWCGRLCAPSSAPRPPVR